MIPLLLHIALLGAPDDIDELEALQVVVQNAVDRISPSVVTIETVGGIRQIDVPDRMKEKMTLPERPRERDPNAPEDEGGDGNNEEEHPPGGGTPRFKNEWKKMLAWPGFKKAEGPTTGVILSPDGYIVTSAWNFEGKPTVITATVAGGRTYAARLLGIDRAAGLALIKIEAEGLPVPRFLKPGDARIGAWAFAIGRAISRDRCEIKYGIVSARNRIEGNALQTDAATSPTNYGGPLIDVEGAVYGIIVPLGSRGQETNPNWYDSGIGFATPIPDPQGLIARLGKEGVELKPAMLGIMTDQERTEPGALVTAIVPESGAAKAGLAKGDIIRRIDGKDVENGFTLRFAIGRRRAGDSVTLVVERKGKQIEIKAVLGERAQQEEPEERLPVPMPGPDRKRDGDRKKGGR